MHELIRSRSAVASFSLRTCLLAIFLAAGARLSALTTPSTGAIAVGNNHVLYLKPDGTVWAWGFNSTGQLGDGTTTDRATPVQVSRLSDVVAVATWGQASNTVIPCGRLGVGTATPEFPLHVVSTTDGTIQLPNSSAGGGTWFFNSTPDAARPHPSSR